MNPEKQQQPMITCVVVNDKTTTKTSPITSVDLPTNYHVNRIQVNCVNYSSSETNDLITNCSSNGTTSPTSSDSSLSSRLFFVDKKLNSNHFMNNKKNHQSDINLSSNQTIDLENSNLSNLSNVQKQLPKTTINVQILKSNSQKELISSPSTVNRLAINSLTPKSIYSEKSLKKQIHQFKERQIQNQMRYYSSTSSTASSTSSQQFLNNKNLIDKHLSDKHRNDKIRIDKLRDEQIKTDRNNLTERQSRDKNLSESEPLSSFNYSLNSNCSTTDTLITNSTLRSIGQNDEKTNHFTTQSTADTEMTNNCINSSTSNNQVVSNKKDSCSNNSSTDQKLTTESTATSKQFCKNNQPSVNQTDSTKSNLNELYLFSIKRPTELKHYTHEIKFMKTPGCTVLTSILIFFAILVISILFTTGIYISGKFLICTDAF